MPDQKADNVILIAGPTAAGKTALAVDLAREIDGEIINADAIQVYADLKILSARPSVEEMGGVAHHLFGVLDGSEACSAGRWAALAEQAITDVNSRGKTAVIVGGTGLYFRALEQGLSPIPETPGEIRTEARLHFDAIGAEQFHAEVVENDPAMAALAQGDTQRLLRAWEVYRVSGRPLSSFQDAPRHPIIAGAKARLTLLPDREVLYRKCEERVDEMMTAGALDEAAGLKSLNLDPGLPIMKALGAAELMAHLGGDMDLERAVELTKRNTRRFIKRQLTWFRNQTPDWMTTESRQSAFEKLRTAAQKL